MLERHNNSSRINEIVNDPSIYHWVRGYNIGPLDLTSVAINPLNVCLVGEHGCVIFIKHQIGIYEFHTCVLPQGRGKYMLDGARFAFRWMFTHTDAFELLTKCPDGNLASKAGARAVGCSLAFRTRDIWPTDKGLVPVDVWSLLLQQWARQTPELSEIGKKFHDNLQEKYNTMGKIEPVHEEDGVHNQYAGATAEMILGGQSQKAVSFYNRYACMSGYKPISIVSLEPIIDIDEAKIRVRDGDFEIIS